jgi:trk system potassium uptake protein
VGAGEVGYHIASRLARENKDVVVIDKNAGGPAPGLRQHRCAGRPRAPAAARWCLEEAGIGKAEILLAVTDSDETNLVACLMANMLSPTTKKLARIRNADYDAYHDTLPSHSPHIDTIINPEIEVVKTIDMLMQVPGAVDVGEFADGRIKFVGIYLDQTARLAGVQLVGPAGDARRQSTR